MQTSPPTIILPSEATGNYRDLRAVSGRKPVEGILSLSLCALLAFAVLAFGAVEPWAVFALQCGSVALVLPWAWTQVAQGELVLTKNRLFLPMLALALVVAAQIGWHRSAYQYATKVAALNYVCYGMLVFIATQALWSEAEQKRFMLFFSAFGGILAAYSIMQYFGSHGKIYWVRAPHFGFFPFGPYANHNHYAGVMELLAPLPLVLSLSRARNTSARLLFAFAACLMAGSLLLSGSRGGMLAFVIQLAMLALILTMKGSGRRGSLILGLFVLVVIPLVLWLGQDAFLQRIKTLRAPTQEAVTGYREIILKDGVRMFRERPVLGFGLGTFPTVYPRYRSFYTNLFVNQAHNDYMQILVETGALGFFAALWFLSTLYWIGLRNSLRRPAMLAALVGCTGIVVHSFTDFNLEIPANAALFFVMCAVAANDPS